MLMIQTIIISTRQIKNVIIIGGGDTGTDCVAAAIRQNCRSVHQFEIMPEPPDRRIKSSNPWPEWPKRQKIDYGQAEAISVSGSDPRHYLISTQKISGNSQGEVQAVHTVDITGLKILMVFWSLLRYPAVKRSGPQNWYL